MFSNGHRTVWADISTFQPVADDSYLEPMLAFRADSGYATDEHAAANWAWCHHTDRLRVALAYVVLIPGSEQAILDRLRRLFGEHPSHKLAVMIDMESGSGFAGAGNHSVSGNKLADLLAGWLGDRRRVVAYANSYDFTQNWPQMRTWLRDRKVTASYSADWPGSWAQQYYGGMDYPRPAGLPGSMAPFGSNVDLNYSPRSIDQLCTDLGLGDDMPLNDADKKWIQATVREAVDSGPLNSFNLDSAGHRRTLGAWLSGVPGYVAPKPRKTKSRRK